MTEIAPPRVCVLRFTQITHGLLAASFLLLWGTTEPGGTVTVKFMNQTKIAKTDGLSRALHPLSKWQYAQKHLDHIFPMAYGLPAPRWSKPPPKGKD